MIGSTQTKCQFTVKASRTSKKSKIMAGGVYPEYLENTDDLASILETKLKDVTGIDFTVDPDSIEYITTRNWVHSEPGWFRMKMEYPIDFTDDYEFLESLSPYMGNDTPIIQQVISDEAIRTNTYSDIEIKDSDAIKRYYDGLIFDYIDDDSYTFTTNDFNKEQDLIDSRVIEKIYAVHDELAQIINEYVVNDDDYYDEDEYDDIEESTKIPYHKRTVRASKELSSEIEWESIPESEDDNGKISSWSTKVGDTYYWISRKHNRRFDVEYEFNGRIIPIFSECEDVATFDMAANEFEDWLNSNSDVESSVTAASDTAVSQEDVDELVLYITNNGRLYEQITTPIIKNMKRKRRNGNYRK